jgi:hypothetical protein
VWAEEWSGRPVFNLALEGRSPVEPLETLARESEYHGLVVVDLPAFFVFDLTFWKNDLESTLGALRQARASVAVRWEAALRQRVPLGVPFRLPELRLEPLLDSMLSGRLPGPATFVTRPDRFRPVIRDYHRYPPPASDYEFFRTWAHPATIPERDSIIDRISAAVRAIQARGGKVVFLRLPACGEVRKLEDENFPPPRFWDVAQRGIPARFLDDRNTPVLSGDRWTCGDGSHLYVAESAGFTKAVVTLVREASGGP